MIFINFIKNHKCILWILFGVPAVIATILRILDCTNIIQIHSSDWIVLLAGLFTFYGTVILALVTVSQNDTLQKISSKQLEFAERQEEISEIILLEKNRPNFEITSLQSPLNGNEVPAELMRQSYIRGFDHEFTAWIPEAKGPNALYVSFINTSESDAYDVSIAEVDPLIMVVNDAEETEILKVRQNEFYTNLSVTTFETIPHRDERIMTFVLSDNEEGFEVCFTMTYRNAYHHWFYQKAAISMTREENGIVCQFQINDCKAGKREVEEHGNILFMNGETLPFPPEGETADN